jgi:hypothetical protein
MSIENATKGPACGAFGVLGRARTESIISSSNSKAVRNAMHLEKKKLGPRTLI